MRLTPIALAVAVLAATGGCDRAPAARPYELQGQILAIRTASDEVVIKHGDIKNFMPGMTMPFRVNDPALLEGKQAGDLVTATLMVGETDAYISSLTRTGAAPLEESLEVTVTQGAVLQPGDLVPDQTLIDQHGAAVRLSSLRGHRVALTFIYLRCPLPTFCPAMDRAFATVQQAVQNTPALADVRLLSISFDPKYDTPAALQARAQTLAADPRIWSFVTATPEEMTTLTSRFGVYVEQNPDDAIAITHNLRTAVIDPEGRVVTVHSGTDWTPAQLVAELTAAPAPAR